MSRKYLTQWAKAAEEWQDANNNMLEAVEDMIRKAFNEFCKDDEDDTLYKYCEKCYLPGVSHTDNNGVCKICVKTHTC